MKLIIAGGGTGGHLFSGIAVAEEWVSRDGEVLFVGTPQGIEKRLVPQFGYKLELIQTFSLKGGSFTQRLRALIEVPKAFFRSWSLLKKENPDVVLGIGGYVSGPFVLAACFRGHKTAVIEQNSIPGLTNRLLGKWVRRVFLTFQKTDVFFRKDKVRFYGNPVIRKRRPEKGVSVKGGNTLLVCGGSQGAHIINKVFVESLDALLKAFPGIKIIHQTGGQDFEWVKEKFEKRGLKAQVSPFFEDMENKYSQADLLVSRAGAGTLTESAPWGVPSILIPYPYAADDHQLKNAEAFSENGAAEIILQENLTNTTLSEKIISLLSDKSRLDWMSKQARELGRPDATRRVVDELYALCA